MTLDIRCPENGPHGPCQLYVGHEDDHALLARLAGNRQLIVWGRSGSASALPFGPDVPRQLPWAPGYPQLVDLSTPIVVAVQRWLRVA